MAAAISLYLDEHLSPKIGIQLEQVGITLYTPQALQAIGDSDADHLKRATKLSAVLCTYDNDLLVLAAEGESHAGLVYGQMLKHGIGDWVRGLGLLCEVYTSDDMHNHVEYLSALL